MDLDGVGHKLTLPQMEESEDYVEALQYGLPPTGGLGFGVDRFVMMLVGKTSIREVISFTHLKPEN